MLGFYLNISSFHLTDRCAARTRENANTEDFILHYFNIRKNILQQRSLKLALVSFDKRLEVNVSQFREALPKKAERFSKHSVHSVFNYTEISRTKSI